VWSLVELQALLDEWLVAVWQNRPHDGLRDPVTPGKALTPNEKFAALVEVAGYVPVPLSADAYIELLPATWRTIGSAGIRVNHRTYDARALNPYRRVDSGVRSRNGRWEVHYDPYDVSQIWVRNHHDDGWITATWTHMRTAAVPFGDTVWKQAQAIVAERGADPVTEAEIAAAADALLDRAERGPDTQQDPPAARRAAARARSIPEPSWPHPSVEGTNQNQEPSEVSTDRPANSDDDDLADVIPLPVFDARKEAEQWHW